MTRGDLSKWLRFFGLLALVAVAAAIPLRPTPTEAGADDCGEWRDGVYYPCVEDSEEGSDQNGNQNDDGNQNDNGDEGPAPLCHLVPYPAEYQEQIKQIYGAPEPHEDYIAMYWECPGQPAFESLTFQPIGGPNPATPPPVPPIVVADMLLVRAMGRIESPDLVTWPPAGEAAILDIPTFVSVENWQDGFEVSDCMGTTCVTLTATPTLQFDPGEPGAGAIECTPPGTRFDPAGPAPEVQAAAPGACAHTYQRRTGAAGRPDEWPGEVTVTWAFEWTASGASGTFDSVTMPQDDELPNLPRPVDEVQGVVVDGSG